MIAAIAAIVGTIIGGMLSVLASLLAQRVQSRSQWLVQEIKQRQQLYSEFVQGSARCFGDALQQNEPDPGRLANLFGEIGRMRLYSSDAVVAEAYQIARKILRTYADANHSRAELRDLLADGSVDLFSAFSEACRTELANLEPHSAIKVVPLRPHGALRSA
jgi:hypothetical protein